LRIISPERRRIMITPLSDDEVRWFLIRVIVGLLFLTYICYLITRDIAVVDTTDKIVGMVITLVCAYYFTRSVK